MADVREYTERISVSASELNLMVRAQQITVDAVKRKESESWIRKQLSTIAGEATTIFALAFATRTAAGVALGLGALIAGSLATNYFLNSITAGLNGTSRHAGWFNVNTNKYIRIEFEAAFVEYSNAGGTTRYITQAGSIYRMQRIDGTWIYAS
ncbi:hypothetical protein [Paenibacillus terrae]|nr:hypothetical protein [Paenibacillus terrae]